MTNPDFSFSGPAAYQSQSDDSILEFSPDGANALLSSGGSDSPHLPKEGNSGSFSWRGSQLDKVGTYQLQQVRGTYHLELSFNYAREATYLVTFLQYEQDTPVRFRLTDRHGRQTEFTRI